MKSGHLMRIIKWTAILFGGWSLLLGGEFQSGGIYVMFGLPPWIELTFSHSGGFLHCQVFPWSLTGQLAVFAMISWVLVSSIPHAGKRDLNAEAKE